jgi:hypothetical protein
MTPAETEWQIQRMVHRTKEAVDQTLRVITVLLPEVDAWRSTAGGGEKGAVIVCVCTKAFNNKKLKFSKLIDSVFFPDMATLGGLIGELSVCCHLA